MSFSLVVFITVLYSIISLDQLRKGEIAMAIVWGGYAFANIGLAMGVK
jgi:hypothetical protein